jgi:signal transduction histidine kinase
LQNAIKFTDQAEQPKVIVGEDEDGNVFVKDNGVGFDMK